MCISVSSRQSAGCPPTPGSPTQRVEDDGSSRLIRSCFSARLFSCKRVSHRIPNLSIKRTPTNHHHPRALEMRWMVRPPCGPHNSGSRKARAGPRTLLLFWKKEAELIGLGTAKSGIGPWSPADGIPHQQHLTCVPVCQSFHAQEPRHSRLELAVVVMSLPVNRNGRKQL